MLNLPKKILVAIDGSPLSDKAAKKPCEWLPAIPASSRAKFTRF